MKYSPDWFKKYGRMRKRPISARVRDAFRVESLEPRVLLSADPILLLAQVLPTTYDEQQSQADALKQDAQQTTDSVLTSPQLLQSLLGGAPTTELSLKSSSVDLSLQAPGAAVSLADASLCR